ncbi:nuclear exosome regulator NRDE2-like [Glandiceps talaboti]
MADDDNSTSASPPRVTPLFPVVGNQSERNNRLSKQSLFPSVSMVTVEEKEGTKGSKQDTPKYDWLQNSSFKPEDAIVIDDLYKKKSRNTDEAADSTDVKPQNVATEGEKGKRKGEKEQKRKHKHRRYSSDSDEERPHKAKTEKYKSHRKRHYDSDEYKSSDDNRDKKRSNRNKKHKKKHKHRYSDSSDDERERNKRKEKHKSEPHYKHKKHKHHTDLVNVKSERNSGSNASELIKPKTNWIDETSLKLEDAYRVDKKCDKNNLAFESLYYLDTARYHRVGQSCVGMPRGQTIQWTDKKQKKKKKKLDAGRYYGKDAVLSVIDDKVKVIDVSKPKLESERGGHARSSDLTYVPLEISMTEVTVVVPRLDKDRMFEAVDPLGIHDLATQKYLQGKGNPKPDISNVSAFFEDKEAETRSEVMRKKIEMFNRKTHKDPQDVKTWLEFVKFQDEVASQGIFEMDDTAEVDKRKKFNLAIMEKKISILEKAIEKNPTSIDLKIEHLELSREFWSSSKLHEHWQQMAFCHPNDALLWQQYLMFSQSSFSVFTFSKIQKLYGKCLSTLSSVAEGTFQSHRPLPHTEQYMLDLFMQQCEYMRQVGHVEKAIAAFQAMIEFNCFCPSHLEESTKPSGQVAFFETFWDSEEAKFGEKGAKGWNKWMHKKEKGGWEEVVLLGQQDEEDEIDKEDELIQTSDPLWKVWYKVENSREQQHWLPWKPDTKKGETEDDCEDPDRMVLFDDISSSLFKVTSLDLKFLLVLRFLHFLGIPTCPVYSTACFQTERHFLVSLEDTSQVLQQSFSSSGLGWCLMCKGVNCGLPTLDMETQSTCREKGPWYQRSVEFNELITQVFSQILHFFTGDARTHLTLVWLQYEAAKASIGSKKSKHKTKTARKFAKSVLKESHNRNNLLLWEAYAQFEWSAGNVDEARKVFDMALALYGQLGKDVQSLDMKLAAAKLCHRYAELELGFDKVDQWTLNCLKNNKTERLIVEESVKNRALHILTRFGEGSIYSATSSNTSVNPLSVLKARNIYQQEFHKKAESHKENLSSVSNIQVPCGSFIMHFTICYALFQYLSVGLQAATIIFEEGLTMLKSLCKFPQRTEDRFNSIAEHCVLDYEILLTAYVRLHFYHMMHRSVALTPVRNLLKRAMAEFPDSPTFMHYFIVLELRSHIAGRVRRYFDHATKETTTPLPWLYGVFAEQLRQHTIEQTLGQATVPLSLPNVAPSTALTWQLPSTGITHRIRSLFEKSVSHRTVRYSVLLWRMYIQFEVLHGSKERGKSIFYRSLQHCPWAKVIYMDAVQYFPSDLLQILDLMMEKEIRVRAPLEEIELLMKAKQQELDTESDKLDEDEAEGEDVQL